MSQGNVPTRQAAGQNPLMLPLSVVSLVAVLEAVVIVILLITGRSTGGGTPTTSATATPAQVAQQGGEQQPTSAPQGNSGPTSGPTSSQGQNQNQVQPHGKVGQRVESGGLALTVVTVSHTSQYTDILDLQPGSKYIDLDVILENDSGQSIFYTSALFKLKDSNNYQYDKTPLGYTSPQMGFGTLSNREKVRGNVDFVVPDTAQGLSLIYNYGGLRDYQTIYIDIGE